MNFYASRDYLDAAASVYFKGRDAAIEDVRIGEDVLRLLVVDGRRVVTQLQFLDYHQPLTKDEIRQPPRQGRFARDVVRGAVAADALNLAAHPETEPAPYIDWSAFESFDAYRAWLVGRKRGLMRDYERRLHKLEAAHGEIAFAMNDASDEVLDFARQWKSRQLIETGKDDYFAKPQTMAFLHALRDRGVLASSALRVGGRIVSVWIGYIFEGSWSGWIFTYDPFFRKYSVGHQLIRFMLEASYRCGHKEFDFSAGGEDYKLVYATHCRLLGDIGRPPLSDTVKAAMRRRAPILFALAKEAKKTIRQAVRKPASRAGGRDVPA